MFSLFLLESPNLIFYKGVQIDRDLWRIYTADNTSRINLLSNGLTIKGQYIQLFGDNPYASGITNPDEVVLKISIKGLPLSVDNQAIKDMIVQQGAEPTCEIRYGRIRNPETKQMTAIFNGDRYVYVKPLDKQTPKIWALRRSEMSYLP